MKYPVKHLRFSEVVVEAVTKFCPVTGQMLGADAVVHASDLAFNIGDQGVDPGQDLRDLPPGTGTSPSCRRPGEASRKL
jgi:hypothetical protein